MAKKARSQGTKAPVLVSLQSAAAGLGVPYTSLRDQVLKGNLPHVRLGDSRRYWVKQADVDQLVERSTDKGDE